MCKTNKCGIIWIDNGAFQVVLAVKNPPNAGDARDSGSVPGSGRSPGEGHGFTPVFLPEELHRQRRLAGYRPWGCKESDVAERVHTHTHTHTRDRSLHPARFPKLLQTLQKTSVWLRGQQVQNLCFSLSSWMLEPVVPLALGYVPKNGDLFI